MLKLKQLVPRKLRLSKVVLVIISSILFFSGCVIGFISHAIFDIAPFQKSKVRSVVDGDTIILCDGRHIRYLGIDAPEIDDDYYHESTELNKYLVEGKIIELQKGNRNKDEYGRYLRYVYVDGIFVNAELVAQGLARAYIFDPNDRYSQVLVQLEQYAKLRRLGLWR